MIDHQQDVINLLDTLIAKAYSAGADNYRIGTTPPPKGIDFYPHIALLIKREFPDIQTFCTMFLKTCNRGFYPREIRPFYEALKRLWEGDNIAEPKGTCPKCKGRKKITVPCYDLKVLNIDTVPLDLGDRAPEFGQVVIDCPACDGTGECQHKNLEIATLIEHPMPNCVDCGEKVDRRKEDPRFMIDTNLVYIDYSKEFGTPLYTEDRRILADGRKTEGGSS